jgi:hypothetical protein
MLRKTLLTLNILAVTTLNVMFAVRVVKEKLDEIAETETVGSEREYILVRFARGDYYNTNGLDTMVSDYQFYKAITKNGWDGGLNRKFKSR